MDLYQVAYWDWSRYAVIDEFQSLIWTERYADAGDFTLVIEDTEENRQAWQGGELVMVEGSDQVMRVDIINRKNGLLTIKGVGIIDAFRFHIFRDRWQTDKSAWTFITTKPTVIMTTIVNKLVNPATYWFDGTIQSESAGGSLENTIPGLTVEPYTRDDWPISIALNYGNVMDALKQLSQTSGLDFRVVPVMDGSGSAKFKMFRGRDLRVDTDRYGADPVVFSPDLDTLTNIEELYSQKDTFTRAYVWPAGITDKSQIHRYQPYYSPGSWFDRTIMIDANDINVADHTSTELALLLEQRAFEEWSKRRHRSKNLSGEIITQNSQYQFGVHYFLGDWVELRGTHPQSNSYPCQVYEYVRTQDSTGERAFPTLRPDSFG